MPYNWHRPDSCSAWKSREDAVQKLIVALILVVCGAAPAQAAAGTLDQQQPDSDSSYVIVSGFAYSRSPAASRASRRVAYSWISTSRPLGANRKAALK